jgi:hypothetical protein
MQLIRTLLPDCRQQVQNSLPTSKGKHPNNMSSPQRRVISTGAQRSGEICGCFRGSSFGRNFRSGDKLPIRLQNLRRVRILLHHGWFLLRQFDPVGCEGVAQGPPRYYSSGMAPGRCKHRAFEWVGIKQIRRYVFIYSQRRNLVRLLHWQSIQGCRNRWRDRTFARSLQPH